MSKGPKPLTHTEVILEADLVARLRADARREKCSLSYVISGVIGQVGLGAIAFDAYDEPRVIVVGPEHTPDDSTKAVRERVTYLSWCLTDSITLVRYEAEKESDLGEREANRRRAISRSLTGKKLTESHRASIRATRVGKRWTPEIREKISEGQRRHHQRVSQG